MLSEPGDVHVLLMRLRREILAYLGRDEADLDFCLRCRLPFPADDFESYAF